MSGTVALFSQGPLACPADTSKFGYKLMNKMGWQDGNGLGVNQDGKTSHIKVSLKNNALGVGAKKGNDDNWLELQATFNNLLENLVESHSKGMPLLRFLDTSSCSRSLLVLRRF